MTAEHGPETPQAEASLLSHLVELRNRLLRAVVVILVIFIGLAPFAEGSSFRHLVGAGPENGLSGHLRQLFDAIV